MKVNNVSSAAKIPGTECVCKNISLFLFGGFPNRNRENTIQMLDFSPFGFLAKADAFGFLAKADAFGLFS